MVDGTFDEIKLFVKMYLLLDFLYGTENSIASNVFTSRLKCIFIHGFISRNHNSQGVTIDIPIMWYLCIYKHTYK